ncbi:CDT1-like protein b isoform X2 [Amborella trichopoda]|nr:CDT1-like protein b isoform X2 [Amborella trichopoda]|eukprot:XP_020525652.1 CDT1-like protein b isoform X2 [Amborella trichopoda]
MQYCLTPYYRIEIMEDDACHRLAESEQKESRQNALNFKCRKIRSGLEKANIRPVTSDECMGDNENKEFLENMACQTPEKPVQPSARSKKKSNGNSVKSMQTDESNQGNYAEISEDGTFNDRNNAVVRESSTDIRRSPDKEPLILPDRYETLRSFFNSVVTSVTLLGLRKILSTFQNISIQVGILAKRKFSYANLAQLKYILPEAIQIEKVIVHDGKSLCMEPELRVSLVPDALESEEEKSTTLPKGSSIWSLQEVFHARLLDFFKAHPEVEEIPKAKLPKPFNSETEQFSLPNLFSLQSSQLYHESTTDDYLAVSSHLPPSFQPIFAHKKILPKSEKTQLIPSQDPISQGSSIFEFTQANNLSSNENSSDSAMLDSHAPLNAYSVLNSSFCGSTPLKPISYSHISNIHSKENPSDLAMLDPVAPQNGHSIPNAPFCASTPLKAISYSHVDNLTAEDSSDSTKLHPLAPQNAHSVPSSTFCASTPSKLIPDSVNFMSETPSLSTPKRPLPTPNDNLITTVVEASGRLPPKSWNLLFSPKNPDGSASNSASSFAKENKDRKHEAGEIESALVDGETIESPTATVLQLASLILITICNMISWTASGFDLKEAERENAPAEYCEMTIAGLEQHHQMLAFLPSLFNTICLIFQEAKRSSITKQELLYKILTHDSNITETRDVVEEQLTLLGDLVPEWICGKITCSGDFIYCINKISDAESIHARLQEAVQPDHNK